MMHYYVTITTNCEIWCSATGRLVTVSKNIVLTPECYSENLLDI